MKCQQCNDREAKMTIKHIVSGQVVQQLLCVECAKLYEKPELSTLFSQEGLLHHLMDVMEDSALKIEHVVSLRCPKCGLTFSGYKKIRKLGCAVCYSTFEEKLIDWIKRYHGSSVHVGLKPSGREAIPFTHKQILLDQLSHALEIEDYERAAVLRDQIKSEGDNGWKTE